MRKWYLGVGVVGILAVMFVAIAIIRDNRRQKPNDDNVVTVRVGYKKNSGYQNIFVALDLKLFKKHNVRVEPIRYESTNQMMQALGLGQLDATAAGSLEVVALIEGKTSDVMNAYITLVFDHENAFHSLLVPIGSTIKSFEDLQNKTIGTMPGSTSTSWLEVMARKFFDPKKMKVKQLKPRLQIQSLSTGQIDALYTVDPIITMAVQKGIAKVLMKGPENKYMFSPMATGVGVISSKFEKKHPEVTARFLSAMYETVDEMRKNPNRTRALIAKHTGLSVDVAQAMDLIKYWKREETDHALVQKYLDFLAEHKVLQSKLNSRALYNIEK